MQHSQITAQDKIFVYILRRTSILAMLKNMKAPSVTTNMAALKFPINNAFWLFSSTLRSLYLHKQIAEDLSKSMTSAKKWMAPYRCSSYQRHDLEGPSDQYTGFQISKSPNEWKYVERILPAEYVPEPKSKLEYPSGWKPSSDACLQLPYFVGRSKNYMIPVYLKINFRGQRRITQVKRIKGDIWGLERNLKNYLQEKHNKNIASQVHEMCGHINFKGDYVIHCQEWLLSKGF